MTTRSARRATPPEVRSVHNPNGESRTLYLKPPDSPTARKHKRNRTARDELFGAVYHHRVQLIPFLLALWVALIARATVHDSTGTALILGGYTGSAVALCVPVLFERWPRLARLRPIERWYLVGCLAAAGGWHAWSHFIAGFTTRSVGALVLATAVCASPWWHHRRARGSIPLRLDGLDREEQATRIEQARALVRDWTAFTSAGRLHGAKLQAVTFNQWSVVLAIVMRRGTTVQEFTVRRLATLESAFGEVRAGAARIEKVDHNARLAMVRFMLADPHQQPIKPPETGQTEIERVILGLFETGEEVLFLLVNTLIGGMTGSGKSGVMNVIIRALARMPRVAVLGIDMKPGAPEFGKWRKVMHSLATDAAEAAELLDLLLEGLERRGRMMAAEGKRVWSPTREQPFIVLMVDEVQEVKAAGLAKKLDRVIALARAFGACVIVATQYPTRQNVSPTVKENCVQKVGLRTEGATADRVIFGEGATRDQWRPSTIDSARGGSLMIRSPEYKMPLLARAYWLDDDDIDREAEELAPQRTLIDSTTWPLAGRQSAGEIRADGGFLPTPESLNESPAAAGELEDRPALSAGPDAPADDAPIDAIVVDDDPLERVLEVIGRGISRPIDIGRELGISRATTYRHIQKLADQGMISSVKPGHWERT